MIRGIPYDPGSPYDPLHPINCRYRGHCWHYAHNLKFYAVMPPLDPVSFSPDTNCEVPKIEAYAIDLCARGCGHWHVVDHATQKIVQEGSPDQKPDGKYLP